jgi:hypothetical protein
MTSALTRARPFMDDFHPSSDAKAAATIPPAGIRHSVAYKAELERLRYRIESMVRKDGGAVLATTNCTVTGSASQGRAMVESANRTRSRLGQSLQTQCVTALDGRTSILSKAIALVLPGGRRGAGSRTHDCSQCGRRRPFRASDLSLDRIPRGQNRVLAGFPRPRGRPRSRRAAGAGLPSFALSLPSERRRLLAAGLGSRSSSEAIVSFAPTGAPASASKR